MLHDKDTYGIGGYAGLSYRRLLDVSAGATLARALKADSRSFATELDLYPTRVGTGQSPFSPFLVVAFGLQDGSSVAAPSKHPNTPREDGMLTYWAYGAGLSAIGESPRGVIMAFTVAYLRISMESPFELYSDRLEEDALSVAVSIGKRDEKEAVTYGQIGILLNEDTAFLMLGIGSTMPFGHGR